MSSALATQPEPAPVVKVSQPRLTNTRLLMSACTVLLLGPLAFGAVEAWGNLRIGSMFHAGFRHLGLPAVGNRPTGRFRSCIDRWRSSSCWC